MLLVGCSHPLDTINLDINQVKYVSDMDNYNLKDYPASPKEFYSRGGDCEDYAIAKYHKLIELGIPDKDILYILTQDKRSKGWHVLLVVKYEGVHVILDNRSNFIERLEYLSYRYQNSTAFNSIQVEELWNRQY